MDEARRHADELVHRAEEAARLAELEAEEARAECDEARARAAEASGERDGVATELETERSASEALRSELKGYEKELAELRSTVREYESNAWRAKARAEAKEHARRESAYEYSLRLEKVWKHAEAFVARCEAEHDRESMQSEARTSSFSQDSLDRLEVRLKTARLKARAAKSAYENCLLRYKQPGKGGRLEEDQEQKTS